MNCPNCDFDNIPIYAKECPVCFINIGFPNVRASQTPEEISALDQRLIDAQTSAKARNCIERLNEFGDAILQSKVVISRNISAVMELISSDNKLYSTFYKQIQSGTRIPEDNPWDRGRPAVDGTLFPYYGHEIIFGALSLNNCGVKNYGEYTIVLKEDTISNRATVFEENSFIFCQIKHRIIIGNPIPPGYRTLWEKRNTLAMAKLHSKINVNTSRNVFPEILMIQGQSNDEDEFIEVHIYGSIHCRSVERIVGPKPKNREDKVIWLSLRKKATAIGSILEEQ